MQMNHQHTDTLTLDKQFFKLICSLLHQIPNCIISNTYFLTITGKCSRKVRIHILKSNIETFQRSKDRVISKRPTESAEDKQWVGDGVRPSDINQ